MSQTSDSLENQDFFQFEADFVDSLRCIPMQVRMKLDTCGVKLKLEHWNRFSHGDRDRITQLPCQGGEAAAAYADAVQTLVQQVQGKPASTLAIDPQPPWQDETTIPAEVQTKAMELGVDLSLAQWQGLTPLQRFALIKLSRSSHENRNFYPALVEFRMVEA